MRKPAQVTNLHHDTKLFVLDTNALIWLEQGHRRMRALAGGAKRLYISPAHLLELQVLLEAGRHPLRGGPSPPPCRGHGGGLPASPAAARGTAGRCT